MAFSINSTTAKKGFTLIELLMVVAIMGFLTAVIAFISVVLIDRAKVAKAQGDINTIVKAIRQLEVDTGFLPNKETALTGGCTTSGGIGGGSNEVFFEPGNSSLANSGLYANFPVPNDITTWKGPYLDGSIEDLGLDPWNHPYIYDGDYECVDVVKGCERFVGGATNDRAVTSWGKDGTQYTEDDIVFVFCGST